MNCANRCRKRMSLIALILALTILVGAFVGCKAADPQTQLLMAYAGAVSDVTELFTQQYDKSLELGKKGMDFTGSVNVSVTELALTQLLGMNPGINSAGLDYRVITDDAGKMGVELGLSAGETELLALQTYLDGKTGQLVVAVPEVLSKAVEVEIPMEEEELAAAGKILQNMDIGALPNGETIENLLPALVKVALTELKEVERSKSSFTASGVTQETTCLTVTVTEVTLRNMANAVLEELKTNKDFKALVEALYTTVKDIVSQSMGEPLPEELQSFQVFWDSLVEELNGLQEELGYYQGDEELCRVHTWVNKDNEILGVQFVAGELQVFAALARDGEDVGLEISAKENYQTIFAVKGTGTEKKDKFSGTVTVLVEYDEAVILECQDVNTKKLEEGYLSGSFVVKPGQLLKEELGAMLGGLELRLTADQGEMKGSAKVEVVLQGTTMGVLETEGSYKVKGQVTMPKDTVPLEEMGMPNLEVLINRLKAAGLNDQLLDQLGQMLLFGMLG